MTKENKPLQERKSSTALGSLSGANFGNLVGKKASSNAKKENLLIKMDLIEEGLMGLRENANEVIYALNELRNRFESVKVDLYTDPGCQQMLTIGKAIKTLLDYKIMADDGSPALNIKQVCSGYLKY